MTFLSVAADIGGPEAVRPWHEAAGATFTTVVDSENRLGRLLDYKIIPNGLFLDAEGRLVGKWIGFHVTKPECMEAVEAFRTGRLVPFESGPSGAGSGLIPLERELCETRVRFGAALAAADRTSEALLEWQKALLMDPDNFVLRKQIWKLRFPEKFLPTIDFAWQKAQLAREREEEAAMRASGCGPDGCVLPARN